MTPHDIQTRPIKFRAIELAKILGFFNNLYCNRRRTLKSKFDPRTFDRAKGPILANSSKRPLDDDASYAIGAPKTQSIL